MDSQGTKKNPPPVHVINASRFLASTLHEVRTPIQTIISTIELLQDTRLDREQTEYVHQIEFSANALLELANDVLDFTKIHSDKFKLENVPFDIIELTERVVDLISVEAFNKKLELVTDVDYSIPKMVMGDPVRVQQVILNLVKNAVKFTQTGFIVVKLSLKDNYFLFEVVDSGIGVDKQKQELIFGDFYQVDASTTRKYGGSGLGLAISKNLVEAMKGRIGIYSDGCHGSNFYFTLPAVRAEFEPPPLEVNAGDGRVLIVDDSRLFNSSLAKKISSFGIKNIVQAYSGEEALAVLKEEAKCGRSFTAAFIDLLMPVMGGWRLASEINRIRDINGMKLYLMVPEG
ncbi:MAG: response regulator, partial [Treponema sp.]|nr:response regulator [Treponema sp.]